MDSLTLLDLLYDGHSCDDCNEQLSCREQGHICKQWNIMSAEVMAIVETGKEMARAIDEYVLNHPEMVNLNG